MKYTSPKNFLGIMAVCTLCYSLACSPQPQKRAEIEKVEVLGATPHDPGAYTQGLEFHEGVLYESTGLNGESSLRKVELETGKVLQKRDLPKEYFGEGLTILSNKIYQLTWKSQKGFIYDLQTFEPLGEFSYPTEGWGLTHDEHHLILSDGSHILRYLDPETFQLRKSLSIYYRNTPVHGLNELEYIKGEILANVYGKDFILRIDPETGLIRRVIDLSGIQKSFEPGSRIDVLNGIAYDSKTDRLFVTGKWWPQMFHIRYQR